MRAAAPEKTIETSEVDLHGSSRKLRARRASGANSPGAEEATDPRKPDLIETMLERGNLFLLCRRWSATPGRQSGRPGNELRRYLWEHWDRIKEQILKGSYEPRPVGGWWDTCVFSYHLHQSVKSAVQF